MPKPTHKARVLKLARSYRGICQAELLAPDVVDGYKPITRLAARIDELEEDGYVFEPLGWRKSTKVYRLVSGQGEVDAERPAGSGGFVTPQQVDGPLSTDSDSTPTTASVSGDRPVPEDVGLPRPEYQAGTGAAVEAEPQSLFEVEAPRPTGHYDAEKAA